MKRMKHPQHGFHHCYDGNEEARMRLNGWVEDEPKQEPEKLEQPIARHKITADVIKRNSK